MTAYSKYRTILCLWNIFVWVSIYHVLGIHFDACLDENYPDGTIFVKVSLEQCKEHCAVRNWCKVLAYRRLFTLCTLYREEDIISKLDEDEEMKVKSCVYITREEINLQESLTCDNLCPSYPATCDIADKKCYTDDCPRFTDPNGVVRGNMNRNQSKVNVKCDWKMLDGRSTYTIAKQAHGRKTIAVLMVKLNAPSFVRGIATQGRDNNGQHYSQYVTEYQVLFSDNCVDFQHVMDETNEPVTFDGNNETDTVVIRMFYQMVRARCVSIFPQAHVGYVSLRFDIIGCTDWKVVFIGTPGHGGLVDVCLTTGVNTTSDLSCIYEGNERNCPQHYRNPLVDQWSKLRVAMVKYALYKKGNQVAFVIFNATDSNVTNWFQAERILNISWTGFNKTADFIDLSLVSENGRRSFAITESHGGCPNDVYFTLTVNGHVCPHEDVGTYPQFYYSVIPNGGRASQQPNEIDLADKMMIYIAIEE